VKRPSFVVVPLILTAIALSLLPDLDITVAESLYCPEMEQRWCYKNDQPWRWFYKHGPLPAVAVGVAGLMIAVFEGAKKRRGKTFRVGLFLCISLTIGPGLLANSLTKPIWGRPRPRELTMFGGKKEFRTVLEPRPGTRGNSFVSGHVATAFYAGALSLLPSTPVLSGALLVVSLVYGVLMSITRIVQGAHFLSDSAWSAVVSWVAIAAVAKFTIWKDREQ
jgi:membrane-associated PAP2 superfamily phosphatase